ncbi:MAG: sulfurtransferase [Gemmatimonadota bacterium]|jgi:thiosulfate/3-mercaptopyruvate sulfurtransferase
MPRTAPLCAAALIAVSATALAAQERPGPLVSAEWLAGHLDDPGVLVLQIDGRRDSYDAGHIPGARFIVQSSIVLDTGPGYELPSPDSVDRVLEAAGVTDDVHIVITTNSVLAATRLWLTLDWLGHGGHASILDGGIPRWTAERRPLVSDAPAPRRGSFTPRPQPRLLVDSDWIAARLDDPGVTLIDARSDAEYTGADGGMGGRVHAGHIPGAAHVFADGLVVSRQADPRFLPTAELRSRFEAAGAAPDREVVAYCMIGARASLDYFVGRMLGYDMRFYDGSWNDWGARDLPYVAGERRR